MTPVVLATLSACLSVSAALGTLAAGIEEALILALKFKVGEWIASILC